VEEKNLLPKTHIRIRPSAVKFDMPVIRDDTRIGKTADHVEREAYERGFEAGERAGMEMGLQKAQVVIDKIEASFKDLAQLKEGLAANIELQCVELAVDLARKILLKELSLRPELITDMVREALLRVERSGRITIRIHPSLLDLFERYKPDLLNMHPDIVFEPDALLSPYGAVIITRTEEVITDLDEQLRTLVRTMTTGRQHD